MQRIDYQQSFYSRRFDGSIYKYRIRCINGFQEISIGL